VQNHNKILTGFSFLDHKWGGVYSGGNYFIFGSRKTGKTVLALKIIEYFSQSNYNTLLLTSERRKSLEIQASSVYFDINEAEKNGVLQIKKIDDSVNNLDKIKQLIQESNPSLIIIDEIINQKLNNIWDNYIELIEFLEDSQLTSFIISSIPTDEKSKLFVKNIAKNSTGIIQLQKSSHRNYSGTITLKPNVGHFEGEFETTFKVEPIKGFVTTSDNESKILELIGEREIDQKVIDNENYEYSNVYGLEEFKILIDSKISLSDKTGQNISLINYEIINNSIEVVELFNVMRNKLEKGDKICFTDSMLYILPEKNEINTMQLLGGKLDEVAVKLFASSDEYNRTVKKTIKLLKPNFKII